MRIEPVKPLPVVVKEPMVAMMVLPAVSDRALAASMAVEDRGRSTAPGQSWNACGGRPILLVREECELASRGRKFGAAVGVGGEAVPGSDMPHRAP